MEMAPLRKHPPAKFQKLNHLVQKAVTMVSHNIETPGLHVQLCQFVLLVHVEFRAHIVAESEDIWCVSQTTLRTPS